MRAARRRGRRSWRDCREPVVWWVPSFVYIDAAGGRTQGGIMAKVAFLGLGVMGYPMAGHLKTKGGHEVTVYNRTTAKAEKWVAQFGGKFGKTPKEAAAGQDFVMCCVGNDNDLREVTMGANGAYAGMTKGAVFVDHTTASAEIARELYAGAQKAG